MSARVEFHALARRELEDAAYYYAGARPGVSADFVVEVERALGMLAESPLLGVAVDDECRHWPIRRFPYTLYYRTQGDELVVIAVAHQRRRPFYWRGRS